MQETDKCDHIVIKNNPKAINPNFYSVIIFFNQQVSLCF